MKLFFSAYESIIEIPVAFTFYIVLLFPWELSASYH